MSAPEVDQRPELRIASATWERGDETQRRGLVFDAAQLGFRLVVVGEDGADWAPDPATAEWKGRYSSDQH